MSDAAGTPAADTVSVIVCAYTLDRWDDLERLVASVGGQTLPPLETIVVIDNNQELERRAAAAFDNTRVRVIANEQSPGLSGARRTGAEHAGGTILAFIDDDAIAYEDWLERLVPAYADAQVLGVGGYIEPLWLEPPPRWFPAEFNWVVGCSYAGLPLEPSRIRNPIGANMSVRADVLRRSGSFDPRLGRVESGRAVSGTAEESELGIRATTLHPGRFWLYEPRARVRHVVPPQRATLRYFVRRCYVEGQAKALLTGLTGTAEGLRAERAYTRSVLPRAVLRDLRAATRGDRGGFGRAAAIVGGFAVTVLAYGRTRLAGTRHARRRGEEPAGPTGAG